MSICFVTRRKRNKRGKYAIYPVDGCWEEDSLNLRPETQLCLITARTHKEAVRYAKLKYGLENIWALEILDSSRIVQFIK